MESGFRNLALSALFPQFCLSCKKEGSLFCELCDKGWVARPKSAACPFCFCEGSDTVCSSCKSQTYLDGVIAYLPYGNPIVRSAISFWKYDGDRSIEPILKRWITRDANRLRPPLDTFSVTHIPIHKTRKWSRGFDQAEHLADWVAKIFQMPHEHMLVRDRKTVSQAKTFHSDRHIGELDGIFSFNPHIKGIPESILLCDDVFTSGATMDAAAKCLKEAGVKNVWGFVIAKGSI